jgi:hypothetical protein
MAGETPGAAARAPRWMRVTLFASLAVNLLIAGLVAGALLRGPDAPDRDRRPALDDLGLGPFVAALPLGDRVALGRDVRREAGAFRANREALRAQFETFLGMLRSEPFDAAAAAALITEQHEKLLERRGIGRDLLLERLAGMTAEERRAYADRLDRLLRRPPPPQARP